MQRFDARRDKNGGRLNLLNAGFGKECWRIERPAPNLCIPKECRKGFREREAWS